MKYMNAETILPQQLIEEIQRYIDGQYLYIPINSERKAWGEKTGGREWITNRNSAIKKAFTNGGRIAQLAEEYYLSESSIRKIIKK